LNVYTYLCICVSQTRTYTHTQVYTHAHTNTHTQTHTHTHIHTHIQAHLRVQHICVRSHFFLSFWKDRTRTHTRTYTHTYRHTHLHTYLCFCVSVHMYVHTCLCVCVFANQSVRCLNARVCVCVCDCVYVRLFFCVHPHRIYDPYYCTGAVKTHLKSLGFTNVYNENEDFYDAIRRGKVPQHDVCFPPCFFSSFRMTCLSPILFFLPHVIFLPCFFWPQ